MVAHASSGELVRFEGLHGILSVNLAPGTTQSTRTLPTVCSFACNRADKSVLNEMSEQSSNLSFFEV